MIRASFFIYTVLLSFFIISTTVASNFDYPKPKFEREMEEMKSMFTAKKTSDSSKNKSITRKTYAMSNCNHNLFKAAIEVLKFAPIASVDSMGGVVVTDWYNINEQPDIQYKVMVYVTGKKISNSSFEVIAFERKKTANDWSESNRSAAVSSVLEEKIIKKAKALQLKSAE